MPRPEYSGEALKIPVYGGFLPQYFKISQGVNLFKSPIMTYINKRTEILPKAELRKHSWFFKNSVFSEKVTFFSGLEVFL
jgi:hypothetical protein